MAGHPRAQGNLTSRSRRRLTCGADYPPSARLSGVDCYRIAYRWPPVIDGHHALNDVILRVIEDLQRPVNLRHHPQRPPRLGRALAPSHQHHQHAPHPGPLSRRKPQWLLSPGISDQTPQTCVTTSINKRQKRSPVPDQPGRPSGSSVQHAWHVWPRARPARGVPRTPAVPAADPTRFSPDGVHGSTISSQTPDQTTSAGSLGSVDALLNRAWGDIS